MSIEDLIYKDFILFFSSIDLTNQIIKGYDNFKRIDEKTELNNKCVIKKLTKYIFNML